MNSKQQLGIDFAQGDAFVPDWKKVMESPIAAKVDPSTSHQAAKEITESGQREIQLRAVLGLVQKYPLCTSLELARRSGLDRHMIARRLPELRAGHLVNQRSARCCTVSGKKAVTWEAI